MREPVSRRRVVFLSVTPYTHIHLAGGREERGVKRRKVTPRG